MTFANPAYLFLLLLLIPVVGWYIWQLHDQDASLQVSSVGSLKAQPKSARIYLLHVPFVLRVAVITLLSLALARPQLSNRWASESTEGIDIMMALDISGTMLAEDFQPTRLEAAKKVATDFVIARPNDQIGLVVFAGEAFTQIPLTIDHHVLLDQLSRVKTGIIKDGTAMGDGLATAVNRLKDSQAKSKVIILLTDGINNQGSVDPQNAAEIAALYDIRLYTIGVGTRGSAPYPFKDQQLLTSMAEATKEGKYFRSTNKQSLENIFAEIDHMEKTKVDVTRYENNKDIYLPLLLLALGCLGLELVLQLLYFKN